MKHTSKILLVACASLICISGTVEAQSALFTAGKALYGAIKETRKKKDKKENADKTLQDADKSTSIENAHNVTMRQLQEANDAAMRRLQEVQEALDAKMQQAQVAAMVSETEESQKKTSRPASKNEEIVLTVTSDGPTLDDALKNALRTAIEQAYGAFVSANTTILNDDIVKDEIVTISNGSIKEYNIVSQYKKENGTGYSVTANATVSLPHLITFAKNHGSECEFAGKTFAMEMKLFEIQKQNELKALYNLTDQIIQLSRSAMTHSLTVGEPRKPRVDDLNYNDRNNVCYSGPSFRTSFDALTWEIDAFK
ncbi:MAG: hypothetical protein K2K97_09790, partial [Muribaculaceae bacterium]|nr:hypothetical protein [Muribaculaceae bacterium]